MKDRRHIHHIKHPAKEFALNLRAYIDTILGTMKCSMDYRTADGVGMLLRYVMLCYVTEWHDACNIESLYSYKLKGYEAGIKHLMSNQPAEPEMWFHMSPKKVAWTCSRTNRYNVPIRDNVQADKIANKYWKRSKTFENITICEWLCAVDHTKKNLKAYATASTLVGTKLLSIFNQEHFFQCNFLYRPHRNRAKLQHPQHHEIPNDLQCYAQAKFHFPDLWDNHDNLRAHLNTFGRKKHYVTTIIAYVQSLSDLFHVSHFSYQKHTVDQT